MFRVSMSRRQAFLASLFVLTLVACGGGGGGGSLAPAVSPTPTPAPMLAGFAEYPLPAKVGPLLIKLGPDGNLWFTEQNASAIGRITTSGDVTQFAIPGPAFGITSAPDGNLWFTFNLGQSAASPTHSVGRLTTAGKVTLYQIPSNFCPTCNSSNTDIGGGLSAGPDGALYLGAIGGVFPHRASAVIRLTTGGQSTVLHTSTLGCQPFALANGPDGAVWFTAQTCGFGRVTPTGNVTAYTARTTGGEPLGIARGPDSALWFTDWDSQNCLQAQNYIGRLSTAGKVTAEYVIPTSNSCPQSIALGPDDHLWFTERNTDKIGRITTSGSITEYSLAPGSNPFGITAGPGGTTWFTEFGTNKIAQFTP